MDGIPGQCFPTRPSSAAQMRSRKAMLFCPTSTPRRSVLASRFLRHASRNGREEPPSATGEENAPQTDADRKLKLRDVLSVFVRLLTSHENRAAMLFVEELASSDVAQFEFHSTLVMFNRQLVDFVSKHSSELSKRASDFLQRGGQEESSTKTEVEVGMRAAKNDQSTFSPRSGPNPVPDLASDVIQFGGQEECSIKTEVKAGIRASKSDQSTFSPRSASDTGGSMRRSVLQLCRRARHLTRRATKVTNFSSMSEQENREAFPSEHKSTCSESSPSRTHSRAPSRYACTNIMIDASNRERRARAQSYDGVTPGERGTRFHDSLGSDGTTSASNRRLVRHKAAESVDSGLSERSLVK